MEETTLTNGQTEWRVVPSTLALLQKMPALTLRTRVADVIVAPEELRRAPQVELPTPKDHKSVFEDNELWVWLMKHADDSTKNEMLQFLKVDPEQPSSERNQKVVLPTNELTRASMQDLERLLKRPSARLQQPRTQDRIYAIWQNVQLAEATSGEDTGFYVADSAFKFDFL